MLTPIIYGLLMLLAGFGLLRFLPRHRRQLRKLAASLMTLGFALLVSVAVAHYAAWMLTPPQYR